MRTFAVVLASLLFVGGCATDREKIRRNIDARAECSAKGGLWAGDGSLDVDGPCFAIDGIIPLTSEAR